MKITALENVGPKWRQYTLIQSHWQLLSVAIVYSIVLVVFAVLLNISDEPGPDVLLCAGIAIGIVPSLIFALPQMFRVQTRSIEAAHFLLGRIDELLVFRGYRKTAPLSAPELRYISKLPRILSWKENEFAIEHRCETIVVRGPRGSIGWLRMKLT